MCTCSIRKNFKLYRSSSPLRQEPLPKNMFTKLKNLRSKRSDRFFHIDPRQNQCRPFRSRVARNCLTSMRGVLFAACIALSVASDQQMPDDIKSHGEPYLRSKCKRHNAEQSYFFARASSSAAAMAAMPLSPG